MDVVARYVLVGVVIYLYLGVLAFYTIFLVWREVWARFVKTLTSLGDTLLDPGKPQPAWLVHWEAYRYRKLVVRGANQRSLSRAIHGALPNRSSLSRREFGEPGQSHRK